LLLAWKEFLNGKRKRKDVRVFETRFADHIFDLHNCLKSNTYKHGPYLSFTIHDPKRRNIHKAKVRDRLLHHAIHRQLYPLYDTVFISDSFSCRNYKGIHKALNRFLYFFRKVSKNNHRTAWVLKCDIRKFFDSIDHTILMSILSQRISDPSILSLLQHIITSFEKIPNKGIPLGNLTSQLFANVYMHEFDQFIKQTLKEKYYIRYADDFVILSEDKLYLESIISNINNFLMKNLSLSLHPNKLFIKTFASGVDFLGWIHFPHYRILRTVTKRRIFKNLQGNPKRETVQSYLGLLGHGNTWKLQEDIRKI
jgi:RNA-directed DNA polymerase